MSNSTIKDARQFGEFQMYWLGESYNGLPLTLIEHRAADGPQIQNVEIWYGEPTLTSDPYSRSWQPPLGINVYSSCELSSDQLRAYQEADDDTFSEVKNIHVRGVDGYVKRYSETASSLSLWAGSTIIDLSTSEIVVDIEQVAQDLIPISEDLGATPGPLPPPTAVSCE